jgi:hypothetical protein
MSLQQTVRCTSKLTSKLHIQKAIAIDPLPPVMTVLLSSICTMQCLVRWSGICGPSFHSFPFSSNSVVSVMSFMPISPPVTQRTEPPPTVAEDAPKKETILQEELVAFADRVKLVPLRRLKHCDQRKTWHNIIGFCSFVVQSIKQLEYIYTYTSYDTSNRVLKPS